MLSLQYIFSNYSDTPRAPPAAARKKRKRGFSGTPRTPAGGLRPPALPAECVPFLERRRKMQRKTLTAILHARSWFCLLTLGALVLLAACGNATTSGSTAPSPT